MNPGTEDAMDLDTSLRPTRASSALAVLSVLGVATVVGSPDLLAPTLVALSLCAFAAGRELDDRAHALAGRALFAVGALLALAGVGIGAVEAGATGVVRVVPALVGAFLVGAALVPVRGDGSRTVLKTGAALVFLSVLVAGLFPSTDVAVLLGGGAATVVAWDVGEHAISVGEQLGRAADTHRVEATHAAASGAVGGVAVAAAYLSAGVGSSSVSLTALSALLLAVVLLTAALHA